MSKLNFSTTSVDRTRNDIGKINENINKVGQEMGTGKKRDLEVIDSILIKNMQDYVDVNNSMLSQYEYQGEKLQSGISSMKAIEKNLSQQLKIVQEKPDNTDARTALDASLRNYRAQYNNEIKDANHLGQRLLTGEVGSTAKLEAGWRNTPASVKTLALTNGARFANNANGNTCVSEVVTITCNGVVAGDAVIIRGEIFRFVNGKPTDPNQVQVTAGDNNKNAARLAEAIQNHHSEALKCYDIYIEPGSKDIVRLKIISQSHRDEPTNRTFHSGDVAGGVGLTSAVTGVGVTGPIDLTGLSRNRSIIGNMSKYHFEPIVTSTNAASTNAICLRYGGFNPAAADAADRATAFKVMIDGESFQGVMYSLNGVVPGNYKMRFTSTSSNEWFSINFAGYDRYAYGGHANAANANNLQDDLNEVFAGLVVNRIEYLKHQGIGYMEGAQVSLSSTKFEELTLSDVNVEVDPANAANIKTTLNINDVKYVSSTAITNFYPGSLLEFNGPAGSSHSLAITLAKEIGTITTDEGKKQFQEDLKKSLGIKETDIAGVKINIASVTEKDIFRNTKTKEYYPTLSMANEKDQKIAEEVLTNAVNTVRAELSKLERTQKLLNSSKDNIVDKNSNLKGAIDDRQSIDYLSSTMEKNKSLSELRASFSMLQTQLQLFSLINKLVENN